MTEQKYELSEIETAAAIIEIENGAFRLVLELLDDCQDIGKLRVMLKFLIEENESKWKKIVEKLEETRGK